MRLAGARGRRSISEHSGTRVPAKRSVQSDARIYRRDTATRIAPAPNPKLIFWAPPEAHSSHHRRHWSCVWFVLLTKPREDLESYPFVGWANPPVRLPVRLQLVGLAGWLVCSYVFDWRCFVRATRRLLLQCTFHRARSSLHCVLAPAIWHCCCTRADVAATLCVCNDEWTLLVAAVAFGAAQPAKRTRDTHI